MKKAAIFFIFLTGSAWAVEIPRDLPIGTSDFTHRSLGSSCYTMDALVDGLPCNPAYTAKNRKSQFQSHLFFGNNVSYIRDVNKIVESGADDKLIDRLFEEKRSSEMEANLEAGYLTEKFGFSFAPYRLSYYSLIRNYSLPTITLYAGQEQVVRTQFATYLDKDIFFGIQFRGVQRKFILTEFTLADALVEDARDSIFRTQDQRALYVEPGLLWSPENYDWSPQLSLAISNFGAVDKKYQELPANPLGQIGGSIKPPIGLGELELGTNFTMQSRYEKWTELFRMALSYKLGATQYIASFTEKQYDLAFLIYYEGFRGGLVYDYKRFENIIGETDRVTTIYIQLGAEI